MRRPPLSTAVLVVPAIVVLFHLCFLTGYGWFRDEFYYLACARHFAFGYVDHPSLSILPLWILRATVGDSLIGMRLIAAAASGAMVGVVGLMAREMGGGRLAQILAMVCAAVAPEYLATASVYSMNVFDELGWAVAGWLVVSLMHATSPITSTTRWLVLGAVIGLGTENKISMLWLAGGIALGLALTNLKTLATRGPWLAGAIAVLLAAPYLVWNMWHGWPTIEFVRRASSEKMLMHSPLAFLASQIGDMQPLTLPVWLGGLWFLLVDRRGRPYRVLGVAFLAVLALLSMNATSRAGYLSPAFTMLFAAGGCWIAALLASRPRVIAVAIVGLIAAGGLATAPLAMPILPVDRYLQYAAALGKTPSTEEKKDVSDLPQFFADRFGWQPLVDGIARVYDSLTPDDRSVVAVLTSNYGEAGAIDVLGRSRGLPFAISGHNNYWLWGPAGHTGDVVIAYTPTRSRLDTLFEDVQEIGRVDCEHCMPYENHRPIFVCRRPRMSLAAVWPRLKHFD